MQRVYDGQQFEDIKFALDKLKRFVLTKEARRFYTSEVFIAVAESKGIVCIADEVHPWVDLTDREKVVWYGVSPAIWEFIYWWLSEVEPSSSVSEFFGNEVLTYRSAHKFIQKILDASHLIGYSEGSIWAVVANQPNDRERPIEHMWIAQNLHASMVRANTELPDKLFWPESISSTVMEMILRRSSRPAQEAVAV